MNKIEFPNYNLTSTLLGGQSFVWELDKGWFYGATQDKVIKLKTVGDELLWQTYPKKDDLDFIKRYLRLDVDYPSIIKKISKDDHVKNALNKYPDLRLLKQDFTVGLLSFILSPQKAIPLIRRSIFQIRKELGQKVDVDGKEIYLFPKTEIIAEAELEELLKFGIGFRARNLKTAAQYVLENDLENKIVNMDEPEARIELKSMRGVGDKVADCVLTYSLGFDHVTPLDVWGIRFVSQYYGLDKKLKYDEMRNWLINYFDGYAAWGGQFLFEYIRGFDPS